VPMGLFRLYGGEDISLDVATALASSASESVGVGIWPSLVAEKVELPWTAESGLYARGVRSSVSSWERRVVLATWRSARVFWWVGETGREV
jgi:hypothetical protein